MKITSILMLTAGLLSNSVRAQEPDDIQTHLIIGQSEVVHMFRSSSSWSRISHSPVPEEPNLSMILNLGTGSGASSRIDVVEGSGAVSPAVSALSQFLHQNAPGHKFALGVQGTSGRGRGELADDSSQRRRWSDLAAVVDALEAEFGPINNVVECWYGADRAHFRHGNFPVRYWPMYFGRGHDDTPFVPGSKTPAGNTVDHFLWDLDAPANEKGRGVLAREGATWHFLGAMARVSEVSSGKEQEQFNDSGTFVEPARSRVRAFETDPVATRAVRVIVGPSAHNIYYDRADSLHPARHDPDGLVRFLQHYGIAMLRSVGIQYASPKIVGVEGPEDGRFLDVIVDLPNGGTLTTLRQFRKGHPPETPSPHQQAVTGFEMVRAGVEGNRRAIWRTDQADRPAHQRGRVDIIDSGSGSPKRGRVRITPVEPFGFEDSVSYLRGGAGAALMRPRDQDNRVYLDMLIEHVPALYHPDAEHPFDGIAVEPYQVELVAPVPAPEMKREPVFEDFSNYPEGVLDNTEDWTRIGDRSLEVTAGVLRRQPQPGFFHGAMRTDAWPVDQEATITFRNAGASNPGSNVQLLVRRRADLGRDYRLILSRTGDWRFERRAGSTSRLADGNVVNEGVMTMRLRALGDEITGWINGEEVFRVTDNQVTSGAPAVAIGLGGAGGAQSRDFANSRILTFAGSEAMPDS